MQTGGQLYSETPPVSEYSLSTPHELFFKYFEGILNIQILGENKPFSDGMACYLLVWVSAKRFR